MFRVFAGLIALGAVAFNAALMLSDRAPAALQRVSGGLARRLSERLDADQRSRLAELSGDGRADSDFVVHVGVWAVATVLVGIAVWSWGGLALGAVAVFAGSLVVEFGQGVWSDTRSVESDDIVANAVGVGAGACVVVVLYGFGAILAAAVRPRA